MAFVGVKKVTEAERNKRLHEIEEQKRVRLESLYADPYLGFDSFEEAVGSARCTSQAEVLARLLMRENLFISGMAGAGKTTIINRFIELINLEYNNVFNIAVTASTGIAATLIGGSTIHSWAGLGISVEEFDPKSIPGMMWNKADNLRAVDVLIIDEVSMLPAYLLTKVDAALKYFRKSSEPFGGVQVVFIGDFLQLPPVRKSDSTADCRFAIRTKAWQDANIGYAYLDKSYRAKDDRLKDLLVEIGKGKVTEKSKELVSSRVNATPRPNTAYTTLFTTNKNVDKYNIDKLAQNPNPSVFLKREIALGPYQEAEKLMKKYGVPDQIELKVGATVILTKNISVYSKGVTEQPLANGSIGKIIDFTRDKQAVIVKFNNGRTAIIAKTPYSLTEKEPLTTPGASKQAFYEKTVSTVNQVPLKLGYAITVHKSQGQSLDGVILDLSNIFQPGLGYVALSRVRSFDDLVITGFNEKAYEVSSESQKISNYVKVKALKAREALDENTESYDMVLSSHLARSMYWDIEDTSTVRQNRGNNNPF